MWKNTPPFHLFIVSCLRVVENFRIAYNYQ